MAHWTQERRTTCAICEKGNTHPVAAIIPHIEGKTGRAWLAAMYDTPGSITPKILILHAEDEKDALKQLKQNRVIKDNDVMIYRCKAHNAGPCNGYMKGQNA